MSMTLVEGVAPTVTTENTSTWSEAETLQQDLDCLAMWIRMASAAISPLVELAPDHERDVMRSIPRRKAHRRQSEGLLHG
jgi:hypothetical protein